jgi:hypothetical protein
MKPHHIVPVILASLTTTACIRSGGMPEAGSRGSKLVSVSMKMPTKIGDKDVTGKMDGYTLSIKKTGGDCAFSDIDRAEKVASGDVKIDASLKQDCDYSIILSFGKSSADGKKLDQVFLSSDAHDGKSATPAKVAKEDLKGKAEITIRACVSVTELGAKELGVSAAECPSVSDDSVSGTIDPQIAQPKPPTPAQPIFTFSKPLTNKITNNSIALAGEVTTSTEMPAKCVLAANIVYSAGTQNKLVLIDDNVFDANTGTKKVLDKTVDMGINISTGPAMLTEIQILESCSSKFPDGFVAARAFDACLAAKNCVEVKQ